MVAITNLGVGSRLNVEERSQVKNIWDIARQQQTTNETPRLKKQPMPAEHTQGAVVPGTIAHNEHVFAGKGDLSAAKTTVRTRMVPASNPSQVDSLKPAAVNTNQALAHLLLSEQTPAMPRPDIPAGDSEILPGLAKDPFAASVGKNKNSAQGGDVMRAMATHPQAGLEDGNKTPAPVVGDTGNGSQINGTLAEAADARNLIELPSGAGAGVTTQADNQATEARAGQPALNRQATPGHMAQEHHGANSGRTLTYTFNSVPGNHNVQVTTGQSVTLMSSSDEAFKQMANHQRPDNYRLLNAGDEQRGQQPDPDQTQEDEE